MKTLIQLTIILTIVSASFMKDKMYYKTSDFADLISDIKHHYSASTVMLVHSISYENFFEMGFMFGLSRMLLRRNFTVALESIHMIKSSEDYYKKRIGRPLIVAFLTSKLTIQLFEKHSSNLDLVFPFWLIIFWTFNQELVVSEFKYNYCKHPDGNPFKSRFDTELLVKCYADENIFEWYSVYENTTEVQHFATWDPKNRLKLTNKRKLYTRRNKIGGVRIRIAALKDHPKFRGISSLMWKIVKELSQELNFTTRETSTELSIGCWDSMKKKWTGVMGQLKKGEVDMSITPMTMTSKRLEDVDFSQPIILSCSQLYIRAPETLTVQWLGHFQTFNFKVWYSIIAFLLIAPVFLSFIKFKINESNVSYNELLCDSYFNVWRIYCQQGLTEHPFCSSLKLAYFSIFISSSIIISLYSAYLISYITLPAPCLPFNDIEGFLADGSYKLIVLRDSEERDLLRLTKNPILKKMRSFLKDVDDLPVILQEGLNKVCTERVALYINEAKRLALESVPCSLAKVETRRIESVALTVTKNNQYLGIIKFHLQRFWENGLMNKFKRQYLPAKKELPKKQYVQVQLEGVAPIFAIIAGGFCLALLILLFEKLHFFFTNNRGENNLPYLN